MKSALVLRGVSVAARHLLQLLLAVPEEAYLRADGAAVALGPFQFELNPLIVLGDRVLVNKQRPLLIGHDYIQDAAVPQVHHNNRPAVVLIGSADGLGHVNESIALVEPNAFLLITRQAQIANRRPVLRVGDNRFIGTGYLGIGIPV